MSSTDTTYRLFRSTDSGAPDLQNANGDITDIYYACLVAGYGAITLNSLVVSSGIATATYSSGHNFTNIGSLSIGQVINISGVTDLTGLNGDFRITVTSSTQFTFDATGISDGTASGTIVAKIASAGWSAAFSATNKYAFKSNDPSSNGFYMYIDHSSTTTYARAVGFESMTDINTGTDPFPLSAQVSGGGYGYVFGSNTAASRAWIFIATSKSFIFLSDYSGNGYCYGGHGWDELDNVKGTNVYGTAHYISSTSTSSVGVLYPSATSYIYIARSPDGTTKSPTSYNRFGPVKAATYSSQIESPTTPDSGYYYVFPRFVWGSTETIIGQCQILHSSNLLYSVSTPFTLAYEIGSGSYQYQVFLSCPNSSTGVGATLRVV